MSPESIKIIKDGGVGVIPTDTLYGVVARAFDKDAVSRVYKVKRRDPHKPCVVLIPDIEYIEQFDAKISRQQKKFLEDIWPAQVSVIIPVDDNKWEYLTKGTEGIAFRVPSNEELRKALRKTGPLIAPSANPEDQKPADNVAEAQSYFSDNVDFYEDGGTLVSEPSTVIKLKRDGFDVIRQGKVTL